MEAAYPGHGIISDKNRTRFEAWDKEDPVDDWERERAKRIEQIDGNRNPFVQYASREQIRGGRPSAAAAGGGASPAAKLMR